MREVVKGEGRVPACDSNREGGERKKRDPRRARRGRIRGKAERRDQREVGREPAVCFRRRRGSRTRAFVSTHGSRAGMSTPRPAARASGARARAPRPRSAACDLTRDGADRPRCTGSVHGGACPCRATSEVSWKRAIGPAQ